jgi:hypothetical protein
MLRAKTNVRETKARSKRRGARKTAVRAARAVSVELNELGERGKKMARWKAKLAIAKSGSSKKTRRKSKAVGAIAAARAPAYLELEPALAGKVLRGETVRVEIKPSIKEISPELRAALDEAGERAELSIGEIFADPAMLSSDAFAQRLGVSRETVNQKRKRCEVLGLDGNARGFRYPEWQLIHGRPIPRLRELFARLENDAWAVYRFLTTPQAALGGKTGVDALRDRQTDQVLEVAQALSQGAFG